MTAISKRNNGIVKEQLLDRSALPTQKTPPTFSPDKLTILLYGPSKIGKSTWAAEAENALFIETEPGLNCLSTYRHPVYNWQDILNAAKLIQEGKHIYKTIIIDTIDNAYKFCSLHICEKHGIKHESDLGHGKGFAFVNNEFYRVINKLALLPYGLILISHSQDKPIARKSPITKMVPTLSPGATRAVESLVDIILYCEMQSDPDEEGNYSDYPVIYTKPSSDWDAGDRTRRLPPVLPLNFKAFKDALESPPKTD